MYVFLHFRIPRSEKAGNSTHAPPDGECASPGGIAP